MRILLLDIETAPNTAFVWGLWQQNVAINQIKETSYVLCWAAKWLGEDEVFFASMETHNTEELLSEIHDLLNQADVVVHFNGTSFDIPTLNREFVTYRMKPPAPYKQVDLLKVAKDKFRFASNKLDFIAQQLGLGSKHNTTFELWVGCMNDDPEAWAKMREYNMNDVILLEKLYAEFLPWITKHPNVGIFADGAPVCPNCGDVHTQKRGFAYTLVGKFQRYTCLGCGNWFRDGKSLVADMKAQFRNVAA